MRYCGQEFDLHVSVSPPYRLEFNVEQKRNVRAYCSSEDVLRHCLFSHYATSCSPTKPTPLKERFAAT
jgi:hypothetical protein